MVASCAKQTRKAGQSRLLNATRNRDSACSTVLAGTLCALPIPQITNPASNNITLRLIPALISPVYASVLDRPAAMSTFKTQSALETRRCPSLPGVIARKSVGTDGITAIYQNNPRICDPCGRPQVSSSLVSPCQRIPSTESFNNHSYIL